jgi:hypothetical protein
MAGIRSHAVADAKVSSLIGREVDDLSLPERWQHANQWVAFRIYTPPAKVTRDGVEYVDVRLRKVEAAGKSVEECVSQLRGRSLDPAEFEFTVLKPPY